MSARTPATGGEIRTPLFMLQVTLRRAIDKEENCQRKKKAKKERARALQTCGVEMGARWHYTTVLVPG